MDLIRIVRKLCHLNKMMIFETFEVQVLQADKESVTQFPKKPKNLHGVTVTSAGTAAVNIFMRGIEYIWVSQSTQKMHMARMRENIVYLQI